MKHYPTPKELDKIYEKTINLNVDENAIKWGAKLYSVFESNRLYEFDSWTEVAQFLALCLIPEKLDIYKNFDNAITINL